MEDQKGKLRLISVSDEIEINGPSNEDLQVKIGILALLDACGISHLEIQKIKLFVNSLFSQESFIENIMNGLIRKLLLEIGIDASFEFFMFQDSIIISLETKTKEKALLGLPIFIKAISFFILHGMNYQLFYRGAVSFGEYVRSPIGYFGTALNEVAKIYEEPRYFGILASKSIADFNEDESYKGGVSWITEENIKCKTHDKKTTTESYNVVNWHFSLPFLSPHPDLDIPDNISSLEMIRQIFNKRAIVSPKPVELYSNTLEFIEKSFLKHPNFNQKRYLIRNVYSSSHIDKQYKIKYMEWIQRIDEICENKIEMLRTIGSSGGYDILNACLFLYFYDNHYLISKYDSKMDSSKFTIKVDNINEINQYDKLLIKFERNSQHLNIFNCSMKYENIVDFVYPANLHKINDETFLIPEENARILRLSIDNEVFMMDDYNNRAIDFIHHILKIMDNEDFILPNQHFLFWSDN